MSVNKFEEQQAITPKEIKDLLEARHRSAVENLKIMLKDRGFGSVTENQCRTSQCNSKGIDKEGINKDIGTKD